MVKAKKPRTVSYLRVSTTKQDTEKDKASVLAFANDKDFGKVEFVEETVSGRKAWEKRKIGTLLQQMNKGDRLIVCELTRLGRSLLEVLTLLQEFRKKGIDCYAVKEQLNLSGNSVQTKIMTTLLALFAELERDFTSMRTKEGLKAARAQGKLLGRPPGKGRSKLDEHRDEIVKRLKMRVSRPFIAKCFGCSVQNLYHWMRQNGIAFDGTVTE